MYHYFPNKDAILDGVVARVIEQTGPALPLDAADWKTVMLSGPASAARALESHPRIGWLFLGRQYTTIQSLQMLEAPLELLRSAGFEGRGGGAPSRSARITSATFAASPPGPLSAKLQSTITEVRSSGNRVSCARNPAHEPPCATARAPR